MENPRKFKIFYNKHEHKYFNYQIKKKQKTLSCNIILLTFTTLIILLSFYTALTHFLLLYLKLCSVSRSEETANIYIRVHVGNVGIYLPNCMRLFDNHF